MPAVGLASDSREVPFAPRLASTTAPSPSPALNARRRASGASDRRFVGNTFPAMCNSITETRASIAFIAFPSNHGGSISLRSAPSGQANRIGEEDEESDDESPRADTSVFTNNWPL